MNFARVFHLISDACRKTGSVCILIGGFAVNYYKVTRQTVDVDFLICRESFQKIETYLQNAGFVEDFSDDVFMKLTDAKSHLMDIDFMFVDEDTIEKMAKDGKEAFIAGEIFIVPSLDNLIALKLHSLKHNLRHRLLKDLPDIVNLVKVNNVDYKSKKFKNLCLKYGNEEIYEKIFEFLEWKK